MFKTDLSRITNTLIASLSEKLSMVTRSFENPFIELSRQTKGVAKTFTVPQVVKWEYFVDNKTGLKILKTEKNVEALDRVRKIADELF